VRRALRAGVSTGGLPVAHLLFRLFHRVANQAIAGHAVSRNNGAMSVSVELPVFIPKISGQKWSCHSCGACCRDLVVHISGVERDRIDAQDWRDELAVPPYVRVGRSWALNKRADGACVFLDSDNRCAIHARYGEDAKPLACRMFPFSVRRVSGGWQRSFRYDCPSALRNQGEPVARHQAWLTRLVRSLESGVERAERPVHLQRRVRATRAELDALDRHMLRWVHDASRPMGARLLGCARLTSTLCGARLKKVRGDRFVELVTLLFGALDADSTPPATSPTPRQCGLLRQSAFAHGEHTSLSEVRRGVAFKVMRRARQLKHARAFLHGAGVVPRLFAFDGDVRFDRVEGITPALQDIAGIDDLLERYLTARIEGRAVCGGGYYGWPVVDGYAALFYSLAVVGWLARCHAAIADREALAFEDVARALATVDRAASRAPALGTFAERARIAYVVREDGIARLLHRYALTLHGGNP